MTNHSYNVWLHDDGTFLVPQDTYAAVRFVYNHKSQRYMADDVELGSKGQAIFRHLQNEKYYEKIRTAPTCLIVRVSQHDDCSDYAESGEHPNHAMWKQSINWQQTLRVLFARCHKEYPSNVAGYDGPTTQG